MDGPLFDFAIAAQPLAAALNEYAAIANRPALFASGIVAGRAASAVRGRYSAEAALRALLEGSGLFAERLDTQAGQTFLLKERTAPPAAARAGMAALFDADGYAGLVQARITQALCADARTAPGRYSAVLRFRLDAAGRVYGARLLGSSGDAGRDRALLDGLRGAHVGMAPPAPLAQQSLTMMVLPADADAAPPCAPRRGGDGV
ncbi:TonB family protein [Janthinobacterium fluminis]|nr:TonB family protein [Janthinobacterium fluminis]